MAYPDCRRVRGVGDVAWQPLGPNLSAEQRIRAKYVDTFEQQHNLRPKRYFFDCEKDDDYYEENNCRTARSQD